MSSSGFAFSFGGDDMEEDDIEKFKAEDSNKQQPSSSRAEESSPAAAGAFVVAGKPQLPATRQDLSQMLDQLPSKVAYDMLDVGNGVRLPRRELWDVKVQVMAEQETDAEPEPGLGTHDVKTGVYEGGFKSWESSVDLVAELARMNLLATCASRNQALRVVELGCGTALPSLALFQAIVSSKEARGSVSLSITVADYNPPVLYLVTLPNFILTWALAVRHEDPVVDQAFDGEEELELAPELINAFRAFLSSNRISLSFISGAWSEKFVDMLFASNDLLQSDTDDMMLLLGAETIYSQFALSEFTKTMVSVLQQERTMSPEGTAVAMVGAKRHYFGVGGSLDDFVVLAREKGCVVEWLREESKGVRRGVVRCQLE